MATGTITLNKSASSGNYIQSKIVWYGTADEDQNNSDVTCRIYVRKDNDGLTLTVPTSGTWTYSMTINGKTFSGTVSKDVLLDWVQLATATVSDIPHNDNGSKSITISGYVTAPSGTTLAGHKSSGSGTAAMDVIPRASSIDSVSCASSYFDGKLTYKYTPQSASFYNRCNITLNLGGEYIAVKTINLGKKSAAQQTATVTLTEDEQAIIYNALPNTSKGTLRFTFRTYSDSGYSDQVGDAPYKEISLYVPKISSTLPDPGATLAPVHSLGSAFDGLYVQGMSKVKAAFTGKGKYGATIKSYSMSVEGDSYDSSVSYTSGYLTGYGTVTVKVTATDSRGYSTTQNKNIYVLAYSKPKVVAASGETNIICARCDSNGNLSDSGTYLKVTARRSYSKCVDTDGVQHNFCGIRVRYKQENGSYSSWKTLIAATNLNAEEISSSALYEGALLVTNTYIAQVDVVDTIGNHTPVTFTIPTDKVYLHRDGNRNSLGIGKYVESDNTVDVAEDITVKVRGDLIVGSTKVADTGWISLGLSEEVEASESNVGRSGNGCYYRVINENHVYVAFNCACTFANALLRVNLDSIPEKYCPARNAYALVPTGGRSVVRAIANHAGNVLFEWVQVMSSAEQTTEASVKWIDGYIDYWI